MTANTLKAKDINPCDGGPACTCAPGRYYVSCIDGPGYYLMAGPYATHTAAVAAKDTARRIAYDLDGRAWFMAWGVCRTLDNTNKPGILNERGLI